MVIEKKGMMFVLSSPSGVGKTTLTKKLAENNPQFVISISHTTRKPRPNEINGKDYHFVSVEEFNNLVKNNNFYEFANIFDNYYGTFKKTVTELISQGKDVLFDIDWQGTQQLAEKAREDLVRLFILPPTMIELEHRLETRAQDSADVVAKRMAKAADEMTHYAEYDYIIINRDVEISVAQALAVLSAERLKRDRLVGLGDFVKGLRQGQ